MADGVDAPPLRRTHSIAGRHSAGQTVEGRSTRGLFDSATRCWQHAPLGVTQSPASAPPPARRPDLARRIDTRGAAPDEAAHRHDLDAAMSAARWRHLYSVDDRRWPGLGAAMDAAMHDPAPWIPYRDAADGDLATLQGARDQRYGVMSNTGWDVPRAFAHHGCSIWWTASPCRARSAQPSGRTIFGIAWPARRGAGRGAHGR